MAISGVGVSPGVDIRTEVTDALGSAATVAEQKLRDLAKSVQDANDTVTKIAGYYASVSRLASGSATDTDQVVFPHAHNYLNNKGYSYENPPSADDKTRMLNDLLTLKDNATSISQKTFSDFQRATEQLQVLNSERGAVEKSLADKLADVIRNWS